MSSEVNYDKKKNLFMLKDVNLYKEEKNHNLDVNRMSFL
jgi:hypothetical protein